MGPIPKIIGGIILIVASVWWIARFGWKDFLTVLNGAIPPLVFLLGVFIVWLEVDELKIERELKKEEEKVKKKKSKKKK